MLRAFLSHLFSKKAVGPHRQGVEQDWLDRITAAAASGDTSALNALCDEALSADDVSDAGIWQRLGRFKAQAGDVPAAESLLQRAVMLDERNADVLCDLANVRQLQNDTPGALALYERALTCNATHELSLYNASMLYLRLAESNKSYALLERLFQRNPRLPGVAEQLASLTLTRGDAEQALRYLIKASEIAPENAHVHAVLGATYAKLGQFQLALATYHRSLELDATNAAVANNFGYLYFSLGRNAEAIHWLEKAIALKPEFPEALNNLAIAYHRGFDFEAAEHAIQRAIQLRPEFANAYANLGKLYLEQGRQREAETCFRQAITLAPGSHALHDNLLLCLNYSDHISNDVMNRALADWVQCLPSVSALPPLKSAERNHKLRIGYVSPDFVTHSVAFFIETILCEHDREKFEIFCYSNNAASDRTTERLKSLSVQWRDIYALSDSQAAELIRRDQIDILVELAGHTAGNRLLLMNEKPAPIQVSYLGYPNTTGLRQIDYRISDDRVDDASAQRNYTETLVRLPRCFLCYQPPPHSEVLDPLTPPQSQSIGYCAYNNLAKVTEEMVAAWAEILHKVPGSVLYLPGAVLKSAAARQRWLQRFEHRHVDCERVLWMERAHTVAGHMERYRLADIALDTYPYNGTTTTMDALWMGLPVVTRVGSSHASRVTYDLLSRIGLEHYAATSLDGYIEIAVSLARIGPRTAAERSTLRHTLASSELLNAKDMAASLEHAYRDMWLQARA